MKPTHTLKTFLLYPFRDPEVVNKMLIGGLLVISSFIIPFIPFLFIIGYGVKIARRILDGDGELVLPAWDDWNTYFVDGVKLSVVSLIYSLPTIFISLLGVGAYTFSLLGMIIASSNGQEPTGFIILYSLSLLLLMICIAMVLVLTFAEGIFLPAALMQVVQKGTIKSAFQIKTWFKIFRKSFINFFIAFIFLFGLSQFALYMSYGLYYTIILSLIIPFLYAILGFYLTIIAMPIFAQAYREGKEILDYENTRR